jgi:hypothetical protein
MNQFAISAFGQTDKQNQGDLGGRPSTKKERDFVTLMRVAVSSFMLAW